MILAEIEELRAKGWYFSFTGDGDGWSCCTVGKGLAHGQGGGETLLKAAETALKQAKSMEDDPKVLIKQYGPQIEKLALEVFGKGAYQGMEVVHWEPGEPVKIALSIIPNGTPGEFVHQEVDFHQRVNKELPRGVGTALVFEVDWPEEKVKS